MSGKTLRLLPAVVGLLAGTVLAQDAKAPEEPPMTFPTEIEQVTVDVVVVDKDGQPVTDLERSDLEIYEDGQRQAITSFELFEVAAPPAPREEEATEAPPPPPPPSRVSTNTDADDRHGRTFVVVFDDVHLTAFTAERAKEAVRRFLDDETVPGDRVTLVSPGSGVWWSARMPGDRDELLELLQKQEALYIPDTARDRMSEFEAMRIHNYNDQQVVNRVMRRYAAYGLDLLTEASRHERGFRPERDPFLTSKASQVYFASKARNHVTLGAIERALKSLVRLQGRKSLILVSNGFIYDRYIPEFRRIITASRQANTAIYFLNGRGMEALPMEMTAETRQVLPQEDIAGSVFAMSYEVAGGSESIAADTGGFTVRNANDLAEGLKRISDETRAYYLVGYNPKNLTRDGRFRKIEVKVPGRRGIEIRARRGYYAPQADGSTVAGEVESQDPEFQAAMDSPYEVDGINLRMTHFVRDETLLNTAHVYVAGEVDISGLEFGVVDGLEVASLEFLLVAISRQTGEYNRYDQKMDLRLPPETKEYLSRTWLPIVREFELAPGDYRAKLVVRDRTSGRISTVIHDFEVPEIGPFRVSTPVLSDMRETTADGAPGTRLALMARREFAPGASLFCQLDVYGAVRLESTGMPRVTMGYEVRKDDGTLYTREPATLLLPTEEGAVSRIIGFPLEVAPPGDYVLRMLVKDELSGRKVELSEPFTVSASAAPPPPAARGAESAAPAPSTVAAETTEPTGR